MRHSAESFPRNLRELRERRNLSLDALAQMTAVSKSMLRQIEMGKSNPSLAIVWKIAMGLRVSFSALLREEETELQVHSFKESPPICGESGAYRLYQMTFFDPERPVETYYMEVDPETAYRAIPHAGVVEERVMVVEGRIFVTVGESEIEVEAGQSVSFVPDRPHVYQNREKNMARGIMMLSYLA
jgi:transcriptional regulator with XRE-family HTH domain